MRTREREEKESTNFSPWTLHGNSYLETLKHLCLISNHVKGWGAKFRNNDEHYPCDTNFGPEVYAKCRFPFLHLNEVSKEKRFGTDQKCLKGPTPSSYHKRCRELEKKIGKKKMPRDKSESVIVRWGVRDKFKTTCYYKGGRVHQTY